MKIIIAGGGKVGQAIAKHLTGEEHDIVLIDKNFEKLQHISDKLDIMCIKGNCLRTSVLISAGVEDADLIIATTQSDEINMLCCLTAKGSGRSIPSPESGIRNIPPTLSRLKTKWGLTWS